MYLQTQDRRGRGANQNICGECTRTVRNNQDARIVCSLYWLVTRQVPITI